METGEEQALNVFLQRRRGRRKQLVEVEAGKSASFAAIGSFARLLVRFSTSLACCSQRPSAVQFDASQSFESFRTEAFAFFLG